MANTFRLVMSAIVSTADIGALKRTSLVKVSGMYRNSPSWRTTFAILVAFQGLSGHAAADAEGYWPPEARAIAQPRPDWVLVVPARRDEAGALVAWDRSGDWMREWIVPRPAQGGLRTVAVTGDSEDARLLSADEMDEMNAGAIRRLASKYGAPAVAVVVKGSEDAAVAAWVSGRAASWEKTRPGENARDGALRVIGELFSGRSAPKYRVTGVRTLNGAEQYRVEAEQPEMLADLYKMTGIAVVEDLTDENGNVAFVVSVTNGMRIEEVLEGKVTR